MVMIAANVMRLIEVSVSTAFFRVRVLYAHVFTSVCARAV